MDQATFSTLMEEIVADEFPAEVISYQISGKELISELYMNYPVYKEENSGHINFLEQSKLVIEFFSLIISSYKVVQEIKEYYKKKREKKEEQDVKARWRELMVKEGIAADKADLIVAKYATTLIQQNEQED